MNERASSSSSAPTAETAPGAIAVIGMACRYPGANTPDEFWHNILGKVESIRFFSDEELLQAGVTPEQLARPNYVRAAAVLADIAGFDAALFGISAREARVLDPQHRVFLECCWAALEDAALDASRSDARIGVFAGCNMSSYALHQLDALMGGNTAPYMEALVGNDKDYLSTRVSYRLNLRGPSVSVGTACSTSLSAVALACQSLQAQACDVVLAGGVCINVPQIRGYQYGDGSDALSTDGHCRAFDAAASGTAPGHGAGVVVLKRLEDAIADADSIYAVIRGYALNNDGHDKVGYWAPSVAGHTETVAEALALSGISAREIGYVEAHGTGTPMGDPIELAALSAAFRADTPDCGYCAIGSVKTNIGHTSQAAGVAGLIKTVLAVQHGQLPPSLHFERPNPKLQLATSPFYVNTEARPWPEPRRAGVSSLGLGGTNVHVVLEQAPRASARVESARPVFLPLSANSEAALDANAERLLSHLANHPDLALEAVASTLQRGRRQLPVRGYLVARTLAHACELLRTRSAKNWARRVPAQAREVVFVFPGVASVDVPALQCLAANFPALRETLAEGIEHARALELDLRGLIRPDSTLPAVDGGDPTLVLPWRMASVLLAEVALARLLQRSGVQPVAVLGHSSGEYAAACVSGALGLADALRLQVGRARLLAGLPKRGAMLSVNLPADEIVRRLGHEISVSAHNADDVTLLSGDADQLAAWANRLRSDDVVCQPSSVLGAAHSSFVEPILAQLRGLAESVTQAAPALTWISTASGVGMPSTPAAAEHWVRHTRDSVRFVQAVTAAAVDESRLFLEVGPGGHLTSLIQRILRTRGLSNPALSSMPGPNRDAVEYLLGQVGRSWALGVPVDLIALGQSRSAQPARLPTYAFEHVPYWIEPGASLPLPSPNALQAAASGALSVDEAAVAEPYLYRPVWVRSPLQLTAAEVEPRPWVLLSDACPLCDALAEVAGRRQVALLRIACGAMGSGQAGGHAHDVVSGDDLALDPSRADAMQWLFEVLRTRCPDGAVLLRCQAGRSLPAEHAASVALEPAALARGLHASGYNAALQWVLLSAEAQPVFSSERVETAISCMAAAVRVLPRELPNLQARWLDVAADLTPAQCERTAALIASELDAAVGFHAVAYRHGQRWEREFRRLPPMASPSLLRDHGRYLITGGLGRMGLSLAQYLTERPAVRVALTYTRELPPEADWAEHAAQAAEVGTTAQILHSLLELRAHGAQLELARIDAGDEQAMAGFVTLLEQKWGGVDGVFHFAATIEDKAFGLLSDADAVATDVNTGPKLRGAQILARLAEQHHFEFCCLASSLSSEFGGLGNYGYARANRALDVLAQRLDAGATGQRTRWLAINFDYYRPQAAEDGRIDPREQRSGAMQKLLSEGALRGRDLLRIIERALPMRGEAQLIACGQPIEHHIARFVATARPRQGRSARPDLSSSYTSASNQLERELVEIWQELLCVAPIGVHDNFFELGGDSLMVLRLTSLCRERLGQNLAVKALLGSPTIAQLCRAIEHGEGTPELFPLRSVAAARHTLFCVPYAGGSALGFKRLAEHLPADCALWVLPAAREVADLEALFDSLSRQLCEWPTAFSVYGHCGGSFAAVELARRLEQLGRAPERVFAAATLPPESGTTLSADAQRSVTDGPNLMAFMQTLGGLPENANEADAGEAAVAMHDDGVRLSEVFEQFRKHAVTQRVRVPLVCLFGTGDPMTVDWERRVKDWELYFETVGTRTLVDAGHYFVHTEAALVAGLLRLELSL
jgi:phthiocerol/phenolphthiocerol synthesis type-I polyketide synthase E